jgi:hypothetical protein
MTELDPASSSAVGPLICSVLTTYSIHHAAGLQALAFYS